MVFIIDRNFYGRQIDSFEETLEIKDHPDFRGVFIRAPAITNIGNSEPIAFCKGEIVACKDRKNMALTFHPELTNDTYFHEMWLRGLQ